MAYLDNTRIPTVSQSTYIAALRDRYGTLKIKNDTMLNELTESLANSPNSPQALGDFVRKIHLDRSIACTDTQLLLLVIHTPRLTELHIFNAEQITDKSFRHVPYHCRLVQSLDLRNSKITHVSLEAMRLQWQRLSKLTLIDCLALPPDTLAELSHQPLTELNLTFGDDNQDRKAAVAANWMMKNKPKDTIDSMKHFHKLTRLTIMGGLSPYFVHDLLMTTDAWPDLVRFNISGLDRNNDLIDFFKSHRKLTHLSLNGNGFTDATLEALCRYLPDAYEMQLRYNKYHCNALAVRRMVWQLPNINFLTLVTLEPTLHDIREAFHMPFDDNPHYSNYLAHIHRETIDAIKRGPEP
ncbi:unnamed protein product [Absidia cylindrospora]